MSLFSTLKVFSLILLSIVNPSKEEIIVDKVDIVEVNEYYDLGGKRNFAQLILWEWSDVHESYVVRHWHLMPEILMTPEVYDAKRKQEELDAKLEQRPAFPVVPEIYYTDVGTNNDGAGKYITFYVEPNIYKVYYTNIVYTKTLVDPEAVNRDILQKDKRAEILRKVVVKPPKLPTFLLE